MPGRKTPKRRMRRAKNERLTGIARLLWWRGWVRRSDLMRMFGISMVQASLDLRVYQQRNPGVLRYDRNAARYVATPRLRLSAGKGELEEAIEMLKQADRPHDSGPWFGQVKLPARRAEKKVTQAVVRAILSGAALHIRYASLHSNTFRWRWITPHALGHDGYRWHARAYCHDEREFRDFVLGRIAATGDTAPGAAKAADDKDWTQTVEKEVTLDASLGAAQRRALELDFLLTSGRLKITSSPALMIYALAALGLSEEGGSLPVRFHPR